MATTALPNAPDAAVAETASPVSTVDHVGLFPIKLRLPEAVIAAGPDACEDWFWEVCIANQEGIWQMELAADGVLEIMPPTNPPSDEYEGESFGEVRQWNIANGRPGIATGPSSAYRLANGAVRCPRCSVEPKGKKCCHRHRRRHGHGPTAPTLWWKFAPLRSRAHRIWPNCSTRCRNTWTTGPCWVGSSTPLSALCVFTGAGVAEPELLNDPETLDGEDVLPGFTLAVRQLIFDLV